MTSQRLQDQAFQHPQALKSLLNQEGFRMTSQRRKILELFEVNHHGQHLSAEEIHQALAEQGESVSFSTIYRALHTLVSVGLLREVELAEDRKLYELSTSVISPHHHIVCVHCGTFKEFVDDQVSQVSTRETSQRGFSLVDCQFTIFGVCPNCQASLEITDRGLFVAASQG